MLNKFIILLAITSLCVTVGCSENPAGPVSGQSDDTALKLSNPLGVPTEDYGIIHNEVLSKALSLYKNFDDLRMTFGLFPGGELETFTVNCLVTNYGVSRRDALAHCARIQAMAYPEHWFRDGKPAPIHEWVNDDYVSYCFDTAVSEGRLSPEGRVHLKTCVAKMKSMIDRATWNEVHWNIAQMIADMPDRSPAGHQGLLVLAASAHQMQEWKGEADDDIVDVYDVDPALVDAIATTISGDPEVGAVASQAAYIASKMEEENKQ